MSILPVVYAFDVDDTLEISDGPVTLDSLRALKGAGHIVGLCGNWVLFVKLVPDWHCIVSFLGPIQFSSKADFLAQLKMYIRASEFILVGNDPESTPGSSDDKSAALQAGWQFIRESDFVSGGSPC
jgi:hypothetical protein